MKDLWTPSFFRCSHRARVTEKEVEIEISTLNSDKFCGHDEIPPKLVKQISKHIIKPLTYIFNQFLTTGAIPDDLKIALVTPVYKATRSLRSLKSGG